MKNHYLLFLLLISSFCAIGQGITWSGQVAVSNVDDNMRPRITLDGMDNPVVLWGTSGGNVMFSRWSGSSFDSPVKINSAGVAFTASWAGPELASAGDTIYVVYKLTPEDTEHIFVRRSFDGGRTFDDPVRVDYLMSDKSRLPAITVDKSGNPVVTFMRFDSNFMNGQWHIARSADFGTTFQSDQQAGGHSGGEACDCCPGTILAKEDNIALLYRDDLSDVRNIWAAISSDNGMTFPRGTAIDNTNWTLNACPSTGPDGYISGDSLYTTFMSGASGSSRIYWTRTSLSDMGSVTVRATPTITGASQNYPRMAGSGKAAAIVWKQEKNSMSEIPVLFTPDINNGFGSNYTIAVSGSTGTIQNVDIAMSGSEMHVVWETNDGKIMYRKGTVSGTGIDNPAAEHRITCFPNPVHDKLSLSFPAIAEKVSISIVNSFGQVVYQADHDTSAGQLDVETYRLNPGIYFLSVIIDKQSFTEKIQVSR